MRFSYWLRRIGPTRYPLKDTLKRWFTHLDTICSVILEKVFNSIHVVLQHVLHVLCELFGLYTTAVNQWLPGTSFELVMAMQTASLPYVTDSINNLCGQHRATAFSRWRVSGLVVSGIISLLLVDLLQFSFIYTAHTTDVLRHRILWDRNRTQRTKKIREFTKVNDMQYKDAGSEKRGKKMMMKKRWS